MVALILVVATLGVAPVPVAQRMDPVARWDAYIAEAADRAHIPAGWIRRVMRAESGGQVMLDGRPITSPAGAMGLMQLMRATWSDMRATLALGRDPFDPHDNIVAGAMFLRRMYDRFGYPGLFGAYNAGPARYQAYLRGASLPAETRAYLADVAGDDAGDTAPSEPVRPALFVARAGPDVAPAPAGAAAASGPALFVIRHEGGAARAQVDPLFVGR